MAADAWATAINVLGPERGEQVANREGLDVLMVSRQEGEFVIRATGTLARYASAGSPPEAVAKNGDADAKIGDGNALAVLLITFVAFALLLFAMAVGVIFGRRSISGSCGGLANVKNDDGSVSCSLCSNPDDACKELRRRMQKST